MSENKENPACAFQKPDPEAPMFTFDHKNEKLDVEISDLAKLKAVPDRLDRIEKKIDLVSLFTHTLKEDYIEVREDREKILRLLKWCIAAIESEAELQMSTWHKLPDITDIMEEGNEEEK